MKDVSVAIVNWNVRDLLRGCLASVYRETKGVSFDVLVADNASKDGSVEMLMKEFPQATLMANTRNLGFAAGNNPLIAMAEGEFIILLNPDCELRSDALSAMTRVMRADPSIGVLGPHLIGGDGAHQRSVNGFPTLFSQALIMLKLHLPFRRIPSLRRYFADDFDYSQAADVEQVKGAAFMMRRAALEEVGTLDERFFIWFEEVDLCKRMIQAGWKVRYTPEAVVMHHGGESFGQVFGPSRQRMFNASLRKYFRKHHGILPWLLLAALHPLSMALAWGVAMLPEKNVARIRKEKDVV